MRELLARLLPALVTDVDEIWSPEDVYPVYAQLISALRPRREYRTIPDVDWSFLGGSSRRALLLCPIPLSPIGRAPAAHEVSELATWLEDSPERLLLVDAVYAYDFHSVARALAPLLAMDRVVALWSCTKSWLLPDALGIASMSKALDAELRSEDGAPSPERLAHAASTLSVRPRLPYEQQRAFEREWKRLAPRIVDAARTWKPPETGYFSIVEVPFETLLERHDILAVPASAFGSRSAEHSVVTCLHDLVLHQGRGA